LRDNMESRGGTFKLKVLTPTDAIQRLSENDPSLVTCNLSKSAVFQMKGGELCPKLAAALAHNTVCQELILSECGLGDSMVGDLATALATNTTLVHIDLQGNMIKDDGATALAKAIAQNRTLMQINLLNQKGSRFGDTTLHAFCDMFDTNVTLLKIIWRLESRQSFRLNKMLVRNNDIDRRIKASRDYADLLPEKAQPIPPPLVAKRSESAAIIGLSTPRTSSAGGDSARERGDSLASGLAPKLMPSSYPPLAAAPAPPPAVPAPPPPAPMPPSIGANTISPPDDDLQAKIVALELECDEKVAAIKAEYAAKKLALIESH